MDNNVALSVENFEGKLNLATFTNIEKGISTRELKQTYNEDKFSILEESSVQSFIDNVNKAVGGEIKKGGFNDTEEIKAVIEKAKKDLSGLKKVRVVGESGVRHVYVLEKSQSDDLQKGGVGEAFNYGVNAFKFSKKGKEVKDKVMFCKSEIESENKDLEKEISEIQDKLKCHPTEKPHMWGVRENVTCPFKLFNWNQTYYNSDESSTYEAGNKMSCEGESGENCQPCGSQEEADMNRRYNDCVYKWIDNCAEVLTLEMYEKNLDDLKSYDLTPEQMIALKF